ncbi:MAG: AAA family ATPase [Chloroflexi bacterium]|nr:AAA family ATPase [Chloroflexota bacterium]
MYRQHFALKHYPFDVAPKADELFDFTAAREAGHRIGHLLELRGIGLLTGEPGSGKTTICRQITSRLHPNQYRVCYVTLSTGTVLDAYNSIAAELGLERFTTRSAAFRGIQSEVTRLVVEGRQYPVLIFDEAHHLHNANLEELRILTNYEMDSENRLCLLLVGLTELRLRIHRMGIHQSLAQRIAIRCRLGGLDGDEVGGYLAHRLQLAGCEHDLFAGEAVASLSLASKGVLRKLDKMAHLSLVAAFQDNASRTVLAHHVEEAIGELAP